MYVHEIALSTGGSMCQGPMHDTPCKTLYMTLHGNTGCVGYSMHDTGYDIIHDTVHDTA